MPAGGCNRRAACLCSRGQDEVFAAFALVDASWTNVLDGRLPAIVDRAGDGASVRGWDFEHDWTDVLRVEEGHEIDRVRVRGQGLVLPVEQARPVDDLVAAIASVGVVDHRLVHAVEVHCRCLIIPEVMSTLYTYISIQCRHESNDNTEDLQRRSPAS
jgi:hypothetical protein